LRSKSADPIFTASVWADGDWRTKYYYSTQDVINDVTIYDFPSIQDARCYAEYVLTSSDIMAGQVAFLAQLVVPTFYQGNYDGFVGDLREPLQLPNLGCNGNSYDPLSSQIVQSNLIGSNMLPPNAPIAFLGGGFCEVRGCSIDQSEFERLSSNSSYQVGKPTLHEFYVDWRAKVQPVTNCTSSRYVLYYNDEVINGEKFFIGYGIKLAQ
jgi:hypothetical protein